MRIVLREHGTRSKPAPIASAPVKGYLGLRGDFKAAVAPLEVAAAALPDVAVVHYHLCMSYVATGQEVKPLRSSRERLPSLTTLLWQTRLGQS